jgi:hypothetical protein
MNKPESFSLLTECLAENPYFGVLNAGGLDVLARDTISLIFFG